MSNYHIVQLSKRRYAVIRFVSTSDIAWGNKDVRNYELASKPMSLPKVYDKLEELRAIEGNRQ